MQTVMSLVGIIVLLGIAYLLSADRGAINRRTVLTALALQVGIAGLIMYVPQGSATLDVVVKGVQHVIDYGNDGIDFVFATGSTGISRRRCPLNPWLILTQCLSCLMDLRACIHRCCSRLPISRARLKKK